MQGYIFFSIFRVKITAAVHQTPQQGKYRWIPTRDRSQLLHDVSQTGKRAQAIIFSPLSVQLLNTSSLVSIIFLTSCLSADRYWPYGSEGCQIHGFQGFLTALASISSSAAVAWDRYHHYCTSKAIIYLPALPVLCLKTACLDFRESKQARTYFSVCLSCIKELSLQGTPFQSLTNLFQNRFALPDHI